MLNVNVLYLVCEHGQIQFTVIFTFSDEGSVRFRRFRRTVIRPERFGRPAGGEKGIERKRRRSFLWNRRLNVY